MVKAEAQPPYFITESVVRLRLILRTGRHKLLEDRNYSEESRKAWLFWMMQRAGRKNSNNNDFQFWQQNNQPILLDSNYLMDQKLEYLHMNPVNAGFMDRPESWLYSSASDYMNERKGMIELLYIK